MRTNSLVHVLLASVAAVVPIAVASSAPLSPGNVHPRQQECRLQAFHPKLARDRDESSGLDTRSSESDTGLDKRQAVMEGTCTVARWPEGFCDVITYTLMPDGNWLVCDTRLRCDAQHPCTADGNHCSWSRESGVVVCS